MLKTDVVSGEITRPLNLPDLPNGRYDGLWSGYQVIVNLEDEQIKLKTKNGVRGINVPCIVIVDNGNVRIEA